ncbi:MAG: M48 family metallopeptidase [Candidatus Aminicenantes bacterium]|nr:MAG: M48 family metallopeptidase [Candidatus Aminicenantes bacterium]
MEQQIEYPGVALNDGLKNGKTGGRIILTGHSLRFEWDRGRIEHIELPLQDLIIKRGGSSGHLIFFEHPAQPGWLLYTEKKSILKKIKNYASPHISKQVTHIKRTSFRIRAIILASILAIGALIYGLYLLRNPINKAIAKNIPVEWETALGEMVFESYQEGRTLIRDALVLQSLEAVTNPLLSSIPDKRYDFHIYIIREPTINAFALPGGYVVLHTGLILAAERAEEVLGVLAHEISHVTLQHGIRKLLDSLGLMLIVKAILGDQAGLWGEVVNNGAFLLNQKFSRGFEREADEAGFLYLVNARIDPRGMIGFFERLREESKKAGTLAWEETLNFLSTHPDPGSRINYLNRKWQQLEEKSGFLNLDADFQAFKEAIKQKIRESGN